MAIPKPRWKLYGRKGNHTLPAHLNHICLSQANTIPHEMTKAVVATLVAQGVRVDDCHEKFMPDLIKFMEKHKKLWEEFQDDKAHDFYTEATRKVDNEVVDVVDLEGQGVEYEIMYKNNSKAVKEKYESKGIVCIELPVRLEEGKEILVEETTGKKGITTSDSLKRSVGGNI